MLTELIGNMLFWIPQLILNLISINIESIPVFDGLAFMELVTIASTFFPVGDLFLYLTAWLVLTLVSFVPAIYLWVKSLIPVVG